MRGLTALGHHQLVRLVVAQDRTARSARKEFTVAYGQTRIALLDRAVAALERGAKVARLALRLATRSRLAPTDLYAALATAKFMAAHELIDQAADTVADNPDPDLDLIEVRQPLWFGGTTIVEDDK
ncbi:MULTISPECIES: hypothetical protein [unclassified Streptomyces]|uniref:hypothetical protein n=1 Tax=unclassified Streptomyces TaxID=2593676 RepID=UPI0030780999